MESQRASTRATALDAVSENVNVEKEGSTLDLEARILVTNFFKMTFNYLYYLGVVPVRFVLEGDNKNPKYTTRTWVPQKVFCASVYILCLLEVISSLRETLDKADTIGGAKINTLYFQVLGIVATFLYKLAFMGRVWRHSSLFQGVMNFILTSKDLPLRKLQIGKPAVLITILAIFTIHIASSVIVGYGIVTPISRLTVTSWVQGFVVKGRYTFWLNSTYPPDTGPEIHEMTILDVIVAVGMTLVKYSRFAVSIYSDVFIMAANLTLGACSSALEQNVNSTLSAMLHPSKINKGDDDGGDLVEVMEALPEVFTIHHRESQALESNQRKRSWEQMYNQFKELKKLGKLLNTAIGSLLVWYLLEGLLWYSLSLNVVFVTPDYYKKYYNAVFIMLFYNILFRSAEICTQVGSLKALLEEMENVDQNEVAFVLHENIAKEVGLRGNDTFTVTHNFLGGYLALLLTCFTISSQEIYLRIS